MSKLYTLDGKLLTETPEIRVREKVYPVDNRQKTVRKLMALNAEEKDVGAQFDEALKLALGPDAFAEIDEMDLPFPAYEKLFELVMAAVTGEEPEEIEARFQEQKLTK
nr:MAG TPA: hypothetical protein [Caudoviricetes sp.]